MASPLFKVADPVRDRAILLELNLEYVSWISDEVEKLFGFTIPQIVGLPIDQYIASVIDKVCGQKPPHGIFYLIELDGIAVGMGGLRQSQPGIAEIKRVYIRPAYRGRRLGETIVQRLLDDAKSYGFAKIRLDSGPFMHSAHRLYQAYGFADRPPYPEAEVPALVHDRWRFMERSL